MTTTPTHHPITGERLYTVEEFRALTHQHIIEQSVILEAQLKKKKQQNSSRNHVAYV